MKMKFRRAMEPSWWGEGERLVLEMEGYWIGGGGLTIIRRSHISHRHPLAPVRKPPAYSGFAISGTFCGDVMG